MKLILLAKDRNAMNSIQKIHIMFIIINIKKHLESFLGGKQFERQD